MPKPTPLALLRARLPNPRLAQVVLVAAAGVFTFLTLREAWVGEDAFITLRTIDNFVHGYGLRWNLDERVQSYTHPLWLLVNSLIYWLSREFCWSVTAVGLVFSVAAFVILGARYADSPLVLVAGLFLPLALSISYTTYSTSGFENSLSHFCYALFALLFLRTEGPEEVPWGGLALAAALGVTTRIDASLFFLPPLLFLLVSRWSSVRWRSVVLGLSPAVAWLLFSWFYYGFFLPNTGPAKINEEIAFGTYFRQGLFYALDLSRRDPVGLLAIGFGLAAFLGLYLGWHWVGGGAGLEFATTPVRVAVDGLLAEKYLVRRKNGRLAVNPRMVGRLSEGPFQQPPATRLI